MERQSIVKKVLRSPSVKRKTKVIPVSEKVKFQLNLSLVMFFVFFNPEENNI